MTWQALKALDFLIWTLRGGPYRRGRIYLSDDATCERMPAGHGVELFSNFPGWCWHFAAWMHNRIEVRLMVPRRWLS